MLSKHYNTTHETGETLKQINLFAESQADRILWMAKNGVPALFTPWNVTNAYKRIFGKKILATSVRRAMSDLTDAGYLEMTEVMVMGPEGRREHIWKLKSAL